MGLPTPLRGVRLRQQRKGLERNVRFSNAPGRHNTHQSSPVFPIGIIFTLSAVVLLVTLGWTHRQRRGVIVPPEARRVLVALERASAAVLKRRLQKLPIPLGITASILVVVPLIFEKTAPSRFSVASIAAPLALLVAGAAFALAITWLTTIHLRSYAFSVWSETQSSSGQALTASYNASVSLLVAAEVVGVLSVITLYGLMTAFVHDGAISPFVGISTANAGETCAESTTIFGLGVVITALWFQQMGSSCLGASQLGASAAFTRQTGLTAGDPRNPAILVDTLSRQLGDVVPRVLDALVTSCIVTSLTLLILNHTTTFGSNLNASPVATIPLLLRGFGLLSTLFGLLTLRATDLDRLEGAVTRSTLVVVAVFVSAVVGTLCWLVGTWSTSVAIAAIFGITFPALVAVSRATPTLPWLFRSSPTKSLRQESPSLMTELLGETLRVIALFPIGAYILVYLAVAYWMQRLPNDDSLFAVALLVGLSSPSALSSWHAAPSLSLGVNASAILAGSLGRIPTTEDFTRRQVRLSKALENLALRFDPIVSDGSVLLCGLAALVVTAWSGNVTTPHLIPGVAALALAAALPTLVALGEALRNGAKGAVTQIGEVERQLRGLRREAHRTEVPEEFVPSYRSCVELMARDASRGGLLAITVTVLLPLLAALTGTGTENSSGSRATLLAMYLSVAAATGLVVIHAGHAAPLASSLANRNPSGRLLVRTDSEARASSFELVDFLRRSIAVSVPLLIKAATLVALAVAAMLT